MELDLHFYNSFFLIVMTSKFEYQTQQNRRTLVDVVNYQNQMDNIINYKMKNNELLSDSQKKNWPMICAYALLRWGTRFKVSLTLSDVIIPLGYVHELALRMMDYESTEVIIHYKNKKYRFPVKVLWRLLRDYTRKVFPFAQDEAVHISSESEEREQMGEYNFTANQEIQG